MTLLVGFVWPGIAVGLVAGLLDWFVKADTWVLASWLVCRVSRLTRSPRPKTVKAIVMRVTCKRDRLVTKLVSFLYFVVTTAEALNWLLRNDEDRACLGGWVSPDEWGVGATFVGRVGIARWSVMVCCPLCDGIFNRSLA
jgi:hypothetical protein